MKTSFRKRTALFFALPIATLVAWAGVAGAQSTGITGPQFNIHSNVDGVGSESDFLRIKKTDGTKVNTVEACEGDVTLWFYVHNGQSSLNNGTNNDGPGVAHNTRVSVRPLPTQYGRNHVLTGKITADNADTVTDTASITCAGEDVKVEYVAVEQVYRYDPNATAGYTLTGDITSQNGAQLGFTGGVVPGCWEYRAIILVKVKITKKPVEPVIVKQCLLAEPRRISRTRYDLTASAQVENTTVQSYTFTTKNETGAVVDTKTFATQALSQTYEFDQPTAGRYTVKAVITTAAGVAEGDCERTVIVEAEPTVPAYSCDFFTLTFADRKATVSFKPVASNGATFKDTVIKYNADGANKQTTTTNAVNAEGKIVNSYTFAQTDKNVEAVATVRFNVPENGGMVVKEVTCKDAKVLGATSTVVNRPAPATSLPKTGMGEGIAGLMAATTAAGTALHRKFTLRRNK